MGPHRKIFRNRRAVQTRHRLASQSQHLISTHFLYHRVRSVSSAILRCRWADVDLVRRKLRVSVFKVASWLGNSVEVCTRHYAAMRPDHDEDIERLR